MKITKKNISVLKIVFGAVWISLLCTITAILELSLLNFILLLLASPSLIWLVLKVIMPTLRKWLHKTQGKITSETAIELQRKMNQKKGLKNFKDATWNLEGIEIWAANERVAFRKYNSDRYARSLRSGKLPDLMKKSLKNGR